MPWFIACSMMAPVGPSAPSLLDSTMVQVLPDQVQVQIAARPAPTVDEAPLASPLPNISERQTAGSWPPTDIDGWCSETELLAELIALRITNLLRPHETISGIFRTAPDDEPRLPLISERRPKKIQGKQLSELPGK